MKIGAVFPSIEIGHDPTVIRDWVQTAEGLGYDYILTYDHVLGAEHARRDPKLWGPYTEAHPFHEPFTLFAWMAGFTSTIELVTGILILPQRQAALVAKQAAEIALLSGNRLRLGVGTGWNYVEYEALGMPYASRGQMFDEQLDVMEALWTQPIVDFRGEFHRVDRANVMPQPTRPIPIWFGAMSKVAIRRAVKRGNGLIFASRPSDQLRPLASAQEQLEAAGRSVADFGFEASLDFSLGEAAWRSDLEAWEKAGGTHVALRAMDTGNAMMGLESVGYAGPADYISALETFMRAIG